jgi:hypothetical protein
LADQKNPVMQIAIVLYPGLTALDAIGPYEVLRLLPDAEVRFVGAAPGPVAADSGVLFLGNAKALGRKIALNPSEVRAVPTIAWQRALDRFRNRRGCHNGTAVVVGVATAEGRLPITRSPSQCPSSARSVTTAGRSRIETMFRSRPRPWESLTFRACRTDRPDRRCFAAFGPSSRRPAR